MFDPNQHFVWWDDHDSDDGDSENDGGNLDDDIVDGDRGDDDHDGGGNGDDDGDGRQIWLVWVLHKWQSTVVVATAPFSV